MRDWRSSLNALQPLLVRDPELFENTMDSIAKIVDGKLVAQQIQQGSRSLLDVFLKFKGLGGPATAALVNASTSVDSKTINSISTTSSQKVVKVFGHFNENLAINLFRFWRFYFGKCWNRNGH